MTSAPKAPWSLHSEVAWRCTAVLIPGTVHYKEKTEPGSWNSVAGILSTKHWSAIKSHIAQSQPRSCSNGACLDRRRELHPPNLERMGCDGPRSSVRVSKAPEHYLPEAPAQKVWLKTCCLPASLRPSASIIGSTDVKKERMSLMSFELCEKYKL